MPHAQSPSVERPVEIAWLQKRQKVDHGFNALVLDEIILAITCPILFHIPAQIGARLELAEDELSP